ncbi:MAG: DUF285 domain-containing protein [Firmicutes bacterium]|nr:DUF285 domain-containing protein [Bacillota bacterium]
MQESDLLYEIIKAIKRNEHGLLDFIVQDILRDRDFRDLLDRKIEIEKDLEEPDDPGEENGMILKIDFTRGQEDPPQSNIFRLYLSGNGIILIDWGDGTSLEVDLSTSTDDFYEHEYDINEGNEYTVKVYGQKDNPNQEISFGSGSTKSETNKYLKEIVSWGDLRLVSLSGALNSTIDTLTVPNNLPETVKDLSYLLHESTVSDVENIGDWNTSNVENMSSMFLQAIEFNGDISDWDTKNVTDMSHMFRSATKFDQNIGGWDTSKVTDMSWMFALATSFNQKIGGWNTSSVTDMTRMFSGATSFIRDLSDWCVTEITSKPSNFDVSARFANIEVLQPDWGNCPS